MTIITIRTDAAPGQGMAIKEALAVFLEQWGDTRVVSVVEMAPEQMKIG